MERAFYNGVLSGLALDGKSFFYVNPLEVLPEACHKDERKFHVKPIRQKWFGCACCPPNITRLLSSLTSYAYTENEDTLFVHMHVGGTIKKTVNDQDITFHLQSQFPWHGRVFVNAEVSRPTLCTLALRIPGWCKNYTLNGKSGLKEGRCSGDGQMYVQDGYLYITREWSSSDEISLNFEMPVELLQSHSNVRENEGKLAVMRGPIVYCLEEIDNGPNLHNLYLDPQDQPLIEANDSLGMPMIFVKIDGRRYQDSFSDDLYSSYQPAAFDEVSLKYVPYFAWNNRGEGEMTVWTRYIR